MTENKTVEQKAIDYANMVSDPEFPNWRDRECGFKAGYAARDDKYKELERGWKELDDKRIEKITKLQAEVNELKNVDLHSAHERIKDLGEYYNDKITKLEQALAVAEDALSGHAAIDALEKIQRIKEGK